MEKFLQFAAENGHFFNANYEIQAPSISNIPKFPSLSDYNEESKFDSALQIWKQKIKEGTENILLPLPVSLLVPTPQMVQLSNINKKSRTSKRNLQTKADLKYFDYRQNPPLPITCVELFDQLIDNNPNTDLMKSVVHGKNHQEVPIQFYIRENNTWGSELIPHEPSPELFETYEDYKKALKKWSTSTPLSATLHHPSEFTQLLGIVSNDKHHSNLKTNNDQISTQKNPYTFHRSTFSTIKSKKLPKAKVLNSLYDLTYKSETTSKPIKLNKFDDLPFKIPYSHNDIIRKFQKVTDLTSESIRLVNLMHSYQYISDPFISQVIIENPTVDTFTLNSDLTPTQFEKLLNELTPHQYDNLISKLPFYLHQLHIVKSNRVRCRFFVLFTHILLHKPRAISYFLADPLSLSNTTSILNDFSFLDFKPYSFVDDHIFHAPIEENDPINHTIHDLTISLFINQLSRLLLLYIQKYQAGNKDLLIQINAQTMTFGGFLKHALIKKCKEIETAFMDPRPIHCVIFHFLCDYDPTSLASIFQTTPFFFFLGKVKMSKTCSPFYGGLCNHILQHPKLRRILYEHFFNIPFTFTNTKSMMCAIATSSFLTSLIENESSESKIELCYDNIYRTLLGLNQLVQLSAYEPLLLIYSIIKVYLQQIKNGTSTTTVSNSNIQIICNTNPASNPMTSNIQESIMTLFQATNLEVRHISMVYEMMNLFLIPYKNDNKNFMNRFIHSILFKNMTSNNEELMVISWKELSTLLLNSSSSSFREGMEIKQSLSEIISKEHFPPSVEIQILLLSVGFTQRPQNLFSNQRRLSTSAAQEIQKKRRPRKLSSPLEQNDSYIIPGINVQAMYENVLTKYAQGQLREYENEIAVLNILMPIFKSRKKLLPM